MNKKERNLSILADHLNGDRSAILAQRYDLSQRHINNILRPKGDKKRSTNGMEISIKKRRDREIAIMRLNGEGIETIAAHHEITPTAIRLILRSQGMGVMQEITERDRQIEGLLAEGVGRKEIAETVGISPAAVGHVDRRYGYGWKPAMRTCRYCNEAFRAERHNRYYCDETCYSQAKKTRGHGRHSVKKKCKMCNTQYRPHRGKGSTQEFCSIPCVAKWRRRNGLNSIRNKEIFYLRYVQGLTFKRIGEIFGLHRQTVTKIFRVQEMERILRLSDLQT